MEGSYKNVCYFLRINVREAIEYTRLRQLILF